MKNFIELTRTQSGETFAVEIQSIKQIDDVYMENKDCAKLTLVVNGKTSEVTVRQSYLEVKSRIEAAQS